MMSTESHGMTGESTDNPLDVEHRFAMSVRTLRVLASKYASPDAQLHDIANLGEDTEVKLTSLNAPASLERILNAESIDRYEELVVTSAKLAAEAAEANNEISACAGKIITDKRKILQAWEDIANAKARVAQSKARMAQSRNQLDDINRSKGEVDRELSRGFYYPTQE